MSALRLTALLAGLCLSLLSASAQVKARLVSTDKSIQAGHPVTVALELVHDAHWHTYWEFAGTGYPTSLNWHLPAGWKVEAIRWPVPGLIKDRTGAITGNGYEGTILLPVTLTPPANLPASGEVTLKAKADWLMCAEQCVPGNAEVSLSLPVSSSAPAENTDVKTRLAAQPFPEAAESTLTLTRQPYTLTLKIPGATGWTDPHVYTSDGWVAYEKPQPAQRENGTLTLILPLTEEFEGNPTQLKGVLSYRNASGQLKGVALDLPAGEDEPAPARATTAQTPPAQTTTPPETAPADAPPATAGSLAGTLLFAWVGGLILNLMPCVFPVLGIKILGFVNQAGSDRRKVTMHGITFTAGVLASFWALAGVLALLRAGGAGLGWGFQLQSPEFVFGLTIGMLAFALSMSGVFEFGLSATGVGGQLQTKSGYVGSFFTGVLATIVATPCSAPFLAPALGAALALPLIESFGIFTAIAIGLSTPYLLLSIFPAAVKVLPRPGAWMETFKQAMAFPLYATVGYLVWVLAGQLSETGLRSALFGLVAAAMAFWLYGRYHTFGASPGRSRFGLFGGAALLAFGVWLGWPQPVSNTEITWEPWSAEAVAKAQAANRTVYVDFTARWCATCQTNKQLVFHDDDVLKVLHDKNVLLLKGDWTNRDPKITAELARFGRSAVPFNLIYKAGAAEPQILPEVLTPGTVVTALKAR